MQKTLVAATLAAVLGFGGAASAADVYSAGGYKDAPVAVNTWTGFYIGVGGGYGSDNHDLKLTEEFGRKSNAAELDGLGGEGGFGTVEGGYDYQIGSKFVIGVFVSYDFADIETNLTAGNLATTTIKLTDSWAIGGRAGYLVHPDTLVYVLGGYSQASFDAPSLFKNTDADGYVVGAGVETQLGGGFYGKLEYRYADYGPNTVFTYKEGCQSLRLTDEVSVQTIRATVGLKLSSGPALLEPVK